MLLFEETGVLKSRYELVVLRLFMVHILFNRGSADDMGINDLFQMVGRNHAVKSTFGINDHDRSESAQTEATGHYDLYLVINSAGFEKLVELLPDLRAAG